MIGKRHGRSRVGHVLRKAGYGEHHAAGGRSEHHHGIKRHLRHMERQMHAEGVEAHHRLDKRSRGGRGPNPIHIKPSHKGLLHKDLGVPQGQKIPMSKIKKAEHSWDPAVRKRAHFADTAKTKFHH